MAYACIYYLPQAFGLEAYPAFGPAKTFQLNWMAHIVVRLAGLQTQCVFYKA